MRNIIYKFTWKFGKVTVAECEIEKETPKRFYLKSGCFDAFVDKDALDTVKEGWAYDMFSFSNDEKPYVAKLLETTKETRRKILRRLEENDAEINKLENLLNAL